LYYLDTPIYKTHTINKKKKKKEEEEEIFRSLLWPNIGFKILSFSCQIYLVIKLNSTKPEQRTTPLLVHDSHSI